MGLLGKQNGYYANGSVNGSINNGYLATNLPAENSLAVPVEKNKVGSTYKIENAHPIEKENDSEASKDGKAVPHYTLRNTLLGCFCTTLAAFFLAFGQACIQLLEGAVGDFQLAAMRTFFQGAMGGSFYVYKRRLPTIPRPKWIWTFVYSFCAVAVNVTFNIGIRFIPAGAAACIRRVVDMLLVTVLSVTLLREPLTVVKALSVTLCLAGVTMLIQPWYSLSEAETAGGMNDTLSLSSPFVFYRPLQINEVIYQEFNNTSGDGEETLGPSDDGGLGEDIVGYILVAIAGALSGCATLTQKYKLPKLNTWTLNLCTGSFGLIVTGTISLVTEDLTFPSEADKIVFVFVQAVTWGLAATLRVKGVTLAPAVLMTVVMAMQIVFLLIGQYTVLNHIQPGIGNWVEITGAVLVVLAIILPPIWQIIQSKQTSVNRERTPSCGDISLSAEEDQDTLDIHL